MVLRPYRLMVTHVAMEDNLVSCAAFPGHVPQELLILAGTIDVQHPIPFPPFLPRQDPDCFVLPLHYRFDLAGARKLADGAVQWASVERKTSDDAATLDLVIQPAVSGGRFSKRLDWNYAQSLKQCGKTQQAIEVLRRAQLGEAPPDFKTAAGTAIEFWTGLRAQSGEMLEVHRSGQLLRPVLLSLEEA